MLRRLLSAYRLHRSVVVATSVHVDGDGSPEWLLVARPSCFVADMLEALATGTATSCDRMFLVISGHSKHIYNACSDYERSVIARKVEAAYEARRGLGYQEMFKIAQKSLKGTVARTD